MEVEEFEERAKSIVEVELKKITTMVKKNYNQKQKQASEITRFVYNRRGYQKQSTCLQCFKELCSQHDIRAS